MDASLVVSEVCRLCLDKAGHMRPIFGCGQNLAQKIRDVVRVEVADAADWPVQICQHCVVKLEAASEFQRCCLIANYLISSHVAKIKGGNGAACLEGGGTPHKAAQEGRGGNVKTEPGLHVADVTGATSAGVEPDIVIVSSNDEDSLAFRSVVVYGGEARLPTGGESKGGKIGRLHSSRGADRQAGSSASTQIGSVRARCESGVRLGPGSGVRLVAAGDGGGQRGVKRGGNADGVADVSCSKTPQSGCITSVGHVKPLPGHPTPVSGRATSAGHAKPLSATVTPLGGCATLTDRVPSLDVRVTPAKAPDLPPDRVTPQAGLLKPRTCLLTSQTGPVTPRSSYVTPKTGVFAPKTGLVTPLSDRVTTLTGELAPPTEAARGRKPEAVRAVVEVPQRVTDKTDQLLVADGRVDARLVGRSESDGHSVSALGSTVDAANRGPRLGYDIDVSLDGSSLSGSTPSDDDVSEGGSGPVEDGAERPRFFHVDMGQYTHTANDDLPLVDTDPVAVSAEDAVPPAAVDRDMLGALEVDDDAATVERGAGTALRVDGNVGTAATAYSDVLRTNSNVEKANSDVATTVKAYSNVVTADSNVVTVNSNVVRANSNVVKAISNVVIVVKAYSNEVMADSNVVKVNSNVVRANSNIVKANSDVLTTVKAYSNVVTADSNAGTAVSNAATTDGVAATARPAEDGVKTESENGNVSLLSYVACTVCSKAFDSRRALKRHLKDHLRWRSKPSAAATQAQECWECGATYSGARRLREHALARHPTERQLTCAGCGRRCGSVWQLRMHRRALRCGGRRRPRSSALASDGRDCEVGEPACVASNVPTTNVSTTNLLTVNVPMENFLTSNVPPSRFPSPSVFSSSVTFSNITSSQFPYPSVASSSTLSSNAPFTTILLTSVPFVNTLSTSIPYTTTNSLSVPFVSTLLTSAPFTTMLSTSVPFVSTLSLSPPCASRPTLLTSVLSPNNSSSSCSPKEPSSPECDPLVPTSGIIPSAIPLSFIPATCIPSPVPTSIGVTSITTMPLARRSPEVLSIVSVSVAPGTVAPVSIVAKSIAPTFAVPVTGLPERIRSSSAVPVATVAENIHSTVLKRTHSTSTVTVNTVPNYTVPVDVVSTSSVTKRIRSSSSVPEATVAENIHSTVPRRTHSTSTVTVSTFPNYTVPVDLVSTSSVPKRIRSPSDVPAATVPESTFTVTALPNRNPGPKSTKRFAAKPPPLPEYNKQGQRNPDGKPRKAAAAATSQRCHMCRERFPTTSDLAAHVSLLHIPLPFRCATCAATFPTARAVAAHVAEHAAAGGHAGKFSCLRCGRACDTEAALMRHLERRHAPLRPFMCARCARQFASGVALGKHICRVRSAT